MKRKKGPSSEELAKATKWEDRGHRQHVEESEHHSMELEPISNLFAGAAWIRYIVDCKEKYSVELQQLIPIQQPLYVSSYHVSQVEARQVNATFITTNSMGLCQSVSAI